MTALLQVHDAGFSCCHFSTCVACEPQTYFRSSLLSLRLKLEPKKPDALAGVYVTSLGKCVPRFAGCVKNVLGSDHKLKKIEITKNGLKRSVIRFC